MTQGLVIEIKRSHLIVMTPNGEFLKAHKELNEHYIEGNEISFVPLEENSNSKMKSYLKIPNLKVGVSLSMAIMLIFLTVFSSFGTNSVSAYVSLDVTPSVELEVNKDLKVIDIKAYNQEGQDVLSNMVGWKEASIENVTVSLVNIIKDMGYLNGTKEVVISTTFADNVSEETANHIREKISKAIETVGSTANIKLTTFESNIDLHQQSRTLGISPFRYAMALAAEDMGLDLSIDEVKSMPMEELERKIGGIDQLVRYGLTNRQVATLKNNNQSKKNVAEEKEEQENGTHADDDDVIKEALSTFRKQNVVLSLIVLNNVSHESQSIRGAADTSHPIKKISASDTRLSIIPW